MMSRGGARRQVRLPSRRASSAGDRRRFQSNASDVESFRFASIRALSSVTSVRPGNGISGAHVSVLRWSTICRHNGRHPDLRAGSTSRRREFGNESSDGEPAAMVPNTIDTSWSPTLRSALTIGTSAA
jgi:hypothetical protein